MAGKLWIGRSIECVEIFRFFLTEFVRQKKMRSWESSAWELREVSGKILKKIRKSEIIEEFEISRKKLEFCLSFFFLVFLIKNFLHFFKFSLDFLFFVNFVTVRHPLRRKFSWSPY
jgi:hypothetical protein